MSIYYTNKGEKRDVSNINKVGIPFVSRGLYLVKLKLKTSIRRKGGTIHKCKNLFR